MFKLIAHPEELRFMNMHDAMVCSKYAKLARKIEKQLARKRRYAQWMKTKGGN
jgi:hypothetical protein